MFEFQLDDPSTILGTGNSIQFNLVRALKLLAYATAPSPGSRYQPGSSWSVAGYATAIEPRLATSSNQIAIANAGIWDLDPHQKTVLADDMGVGLSLCVIDTAYGIDGLWDCYGLWREGLLQLREDGRHRRMPDFLVLLRTPFAGSKMALLECKGSTRNAVANGQLASACWQLGNVTSALGVSSEEHQIPRIGIACMLHPGSPVVITVADPPDELALPNNIETLLRANYVALELSALGDIGAADSLRLRYKLPSWGRLGLQSSVLPRVESLGIHQSVISVLSGSSRLSQKAREVVDTDLIEKLCLARAELTIGPSYRAIQLRENAENETALRIDPTAKVNHPAVQLAEYDEGIASGIRRRRESDQADDGSISSLSVDILAAPN